MEERVFLRTLEEAREELGVNARQLKRVILGIYDKCLELFSDAGTVRLDARPPLVMEAGRIMIYVPGENRYVDLKDYLKMLDSMPKHVKYRELCFIAEAIPKLLNEALKKLQATRAEVLEKLSKLVLLLHVMQ